MTAASGKSCNETCLQNGLHYATLLGDAARNGFNTVFKALSRQEVQSYGLTYLIALLHKSTIGTKVFEVPQITDHDVQIFAYCGRVGNGSLTLMAINHHSEDFEFDFKLASKQHSTEVLQYVITVADGTILLNEETFNFEAQLEPSARVRPILKGLQLTIPTQAIAFWVVPNLNLRECFDDYQDLRSKVSRSVTVLESSVDQLLQELIAERAGRQDITQMSRRKRSTDAVEDELKESELVENKQKRGPRAKGKREPRQTLNYRRKERTVRLKEKRAERRQLKLQRRPLRERGKRQSRKRSRCANPSKLKDSKKKTKRSSLAEAVNHPPVFGESYEEQVNRSSFPQGDVHLVISKGPEEEDLLSIEEAPIRQNRKKYRRKKTSKANSSEKDLRFVVPQVAFIREQEMPRPELEVAESIHRQISLNEPEEITKKPKVYPINRELVEVSEIQEAIRTGVPIVKRDHGETDESSLRDDTEGGDYEEQSMEEEQNMDEEQIQDEGGEEQPEDSADNASLPDHSLGASPELGRSIGLSDEDMSEDSSEAYDEMLERRKRSLPSSETDFQLEEPSLVNSTKLQQKFVEMFDQLLGSFQIKSQENSARENLDDDDADQELQRSKRNALLHPRSWESRERTNLLHQKRTSTESRENRISAEQLEEVQKIRAELSKSRIDEQSSTTESNVRNTTASSKDSDRPAVLMMRTVTQLVKSVSTELSRVLSKWLPKSKK